MSERVSDYQLEQIAKMIREELIWLGIIGDTEKVIFDKGSKTMGRAYRIYTGGYSDRVFGLGDGYLGQTKREAWLSLRAILRTLEAVRGAGK